VQIRFRLFIVLTWDNWSRVDWQIYSTCAFSAVWNAGLHFLNSLHLHFSKHLDNKVHPCLAEETVIVEVVTDLHGFYDSWGCCKDLANGVSVEIFTGTCYAKQMCSVTCWATEECCTEQNQDPRSSLCCFPETL